MWDIKQVSAMFNDWFQIVKKHMPKEKAKDDFYEAVFMDLVKFSEKYRNDVSEADRWLVVAMSDVLLNYEVRRLEGMKSNDELNFKEYLRKKLRS